MEFDYGQMFNSLSSQNPTVESVNSQMLGSFYYPEQLLASPFAPDTNRHRPTKRTDYFEEAQAFYDEQKRKIKSRSQTKKRKVEPKNEEEK
ncbi:hypothetical protein DL769_001255 [Monosporascus sp. CRB-8-3]|nr:hypothetical protein DL769_001255 [Monosporascus sp. CRB-8-3]